MMRGEVTSMTVGEVPVIPGRIRKSTESFVPWKKTRTSVEGGAAINVADHEVPAPGNKKGNPILRSNGTSKTTIYPQRRAHSTVVDSGGGHTTSSGRLVRLSRESSQNKENEVPPRVGMEEGKESVGGSQSSRGKQQIQLREDLSLKKLSKTSTVRSAADVFHRNKERRFSCLKTVQRMEGQETRKTRSASATQLLHAEGTSYSSKTRAHKEDEMDDGLQTSPPLENMQDATYEEHEEYCEHENVQRTETGALGTTHDVGLSAEDENEKVMTDNGDDEDTASIGEEEPADKEYEDRDVTQLMYQTKSQRKKERRQEKAWLEKQGERRRQDGLPRNFLLVDEYTKKPYGVGVGDWRKELMLLSQNLDPAIGNINKQPDGAIAEIVEWIQHTWEYSCPIKNEYVKEVIARGITLRRAELWKKIRNGEAKPTKILDRTWCSLERQLQNPASIKKSENCRKANASRVNFGRTGPSGEVGVRQRLRRLLRRSPNPEEIRFEMARDKSYVSREQKVKDYNNDVSGSKIQRQVIVHRGRVRGRTENLELQEIIENEEEDRAQFASEEVNFQDNVVQEDRDEEVNDTVSSLSAQQISQHPFVLMMMQRLQALEERQRGAPSMEDHVIADNVATASDQVEDSETHHISEELKAAENGRHFYRNAGTRTTGKQRTKTK